MKYWDPFYINTSHIKYRRYLIEYMSFSGGPKP